MDLSTDNLLGDRYPDLPLVADRRKIRVLRVHTGRWDSELQATLRVVSLDQSPEYEALSYTWGATTKHRTILLNGKHKVHITDNLFNALRRFRQRREERDIWIDALCIDQTNLAERSSQVSMMADIYRSAESVAIWLGDVKSSFVVDIVRLVRCLIREIQWPMTYQSTITLFFRIIPRLLRSEIFRMDKAIRNTSPRWVDRAWVRQELMLSRGLFVCFGSTRLELDGTWTDQPDPGFVVAALRQTASFGHWLGLKEVTDFYHTVSTMKRYVTLVQRGAPEPDRPIAIELYSLLHAIDHEATSDATDPRDKIYSLLGLIPTVQASLVGSDYTVSCSEVYTRATFASLAFRCDFSCLEQYLRPRPFDAAGALPSWAVGPDSMKIIDIQSPAVLYPGQKMSCIQLSLASWDYRILIISALDLGSVACVPLMDACPATSYDHRYAMLTRILESFDGMMQQMQKALVPIADDVRRRVLDRATTIQRCTDATRGYKYPDFIGILSIFSAWCEIVHHGLADPSLNDAGGLFDSRGMPSSHFEDRGNVISYLCQCSGEVKRYMTTPPKKHPLDSGLCLFATSEAFLGLAPNGTSPGDRLVLAPGAKLPLVLGPTGKTWTLRGFAYVNGIMNGELMELWKDRELQYEKFHIR